MPKDQRTGDLPQIAALLRKLCPQLPAMEAQSEIGMHVEEAFRLGAFDDSALYGLRTEIRRVFSYREGHDEFTTFKYWDLILGRSIGWLYDNAGLAGTPAQSEWPDGEDERLQFGCGVLAVLIDRRQHRHDPINSSTSDDSQYRASWYIKATEGGLYPDLLGRALRGGGSRVRSEVDAITMTYQA